MLWVTVVAKFQKCVINYEKFTRTSGLSIINFSVRRSHTFISAIFASIYISTRVQYYVYILINILYTFLYILLKSLWCTYTQSYRVLYNGRWPRRYPRPRPVADRGYSFIYESLQDPHIFLNMNADGMYRRQVSGGGKGVCCT